MSTCESVMGERVAMCVEHTCACVPAAHTHVLILVDVWKHVPTHVTCGDGN